MEAMKAQIEAMAPGEWADFLAWVVGPERDRRQALPLIEETRAEDRDTLWETHPELRPDFETGVPEEVVEGTLFPAYVQPLGAHDCYPLGAGVSEGGRNYVSLHPANVWPPSTPHPGLWREVPVKTPDPAPSTPHPGLWREVPVKTPDPAPEEPPAEVEPEVAEFVQPTGAHDAYAIGDRVRFEGHTYRSLIDGNAHSPAAYPAGWEKED